jgi:hypothetical protein
MRRLLCFHTKNLCSHAAPPCTTRQQRRGHPRVPCPMSRVFVCSSSVTSVASGGTRSHVASRLRRRRTGNQIASDTASKGAHTATGATALPPPARFSQWQWPAPMTVHRPVARRLVQLSAECVLEVEEDVQPRHVYLSEAASHVTLDDIVRWDENPCLATAAVVAQMPPPPPPPCCGSSVSSDLEDNPCLLVDVPLDDDSKRGPSGVTYVAVCHRLHALIPALGHDIVMLFEPFTFVSIAQLLAGWLAGWLAWLAAVRTESVEWLSRIQSPCPNHSTCACVTQRAHVCRQR